MATIQLSDGGRYLSAALPESIMVTGTPPVTLCITDEDDGILYNQKFHVGSFSFHELREVIESHMRQRHKCISSLEVAATDSVTNVAKQIQVAFATQLPSGAGMQEFAERYFLTPATARRVPEEATVSLVALTFGKTETLSATLCYVKENGRSGVSRMENPGFIQSDMDYPQQLCITVSVMEAAALLADEMPGATLTSLTVELGSRSASFFIDRKMHATPPLRIEFLNCFNASDAVWLPAVMERSVTLDYSEGSVGHRLVAYDFEENTEFDVTTAGLTSGEALLLEQALVSRNVLVDACYVDGKKNANVFSASVGCEIFHIQRPGVSPGRQFYHQICRQDTPFRHRRLQNIHRTVHTAIRMNSIHITTAFRMLNSGKPVDLSCWTQKGEIRHYKDCVSLRYDTRTGVRNIKLLESRQIRKIRDCCIFKINDMEVYL